MQQNNEFSFTLNGPTLNVRKVEHFDGLEGGLYRRIFIAHNGLWYAELQSEPEQDYDAYFRKALDAASILIGATTYECVDLAVVAISPQIGKNCVVVAPNGVYSIGVTGNLLPMQISGAMYTPPQAVNRTPSFTHGQAFVRHLDNYRPVTPTAHYSARNSQQVTIPGVIHLGIFIENNGFLHWLAAERGHVTPMPVINPTLSFEDRIELEKILREMIRALGIQHSYPQPCGFVERPDVFTSNDPKQHRFDMSGNQRNQQEIG